MKLRLFLDTNVLLGILLERPGYEPMLDILQMGSDGEVSLCTSYLSMANIAYVLRKEYRSGVLLPTLKQISSLVEILPMDNAQLQKAILLSGPDFEDILQAVCAAAAGCQVIVTHNTKHFAIHRALADDWTLPEILTPASFLDKYTYLVDYLK
ncbi:MAG: PIN domain-containing protein [Bacteroidales bacterium]|nr:PIN domain-containing protein [Bacteroidales bacterium]